MQEHNLDHQKLLLGALISSKELFTRCQSIIQIDYWHGQLQKTVKFLVEFAEQYKSIPSVSQIYAHSGITLELISEMSPEHQQYFMDEIEKFCQHQALTHAILKGSEMLEEHRYGEIEKLVRDALLVGLHKSLGIDYFKNVKDRLMGLKDSNGKMSTGWASLDQKLYNVNRAELMIFCAPSGGGKSVALQNMAINMALQGYNCVYITLELSEALCSMRIDSMLTGIKSTEIFKRIDDVVMLVGQTAKQSGMITLKKMGSGVNARDIRSYLKEYQIQKGVSPDVIIVDYLDLMMPNDKKISAENLFTKDKLVAEELRNLGHESNALVITASQLGRSAIDSQEFNHAHIAGGISKINTADNVIGIYNTSRARERGEIEFQMMKTRNSGSVDQKITMSYNIESLRIGDSEHDSSNPSGGNNGYSKPPQQSSSVMNQINRKPTSNKPSVTPQSGQESSVELRNIEIIVSSDQTTQETIWISDAESESDAKSKAIQKFVIDYPDHSNVQAHTYKEFHSKNQSASQPVGNRAAALSSLLKSVKRYS